MIFDKDGNTTVISQEGASVSEFAKKFNDLYARFKNDNIIINLTTLKRISNKDITEFLQISNFHRRAKNSFVIVTDKIQIDDIPDELIVVPTIQEAYDVIEMEEMERDLGF